MSKRNNSKFKIL